MGVFGHACKGNTINPFLEFELVNAVFGIYHELPFNWKYQFLRNVKFMVFLFETPNLS